MKSNMDKRFSCFLDHTDSKFSPLAAAACFLDPTVAPEALLENEDEQTEALLRRSEDYIAQLVPPVVREEEAEDVEPEEGEESKEEQPHNKRPRFRFLSKPSRPSKSTLSKPCVKEEIKKFKEQLSQPTNQETALEFWAAQGDSVYLSLKPIALDLLAMLASQAFAERVFSITGDLSRCRRNRARVILERSAFLKLNRVALLYGYNTSLGRPCSHKLNSRTLQFSLCIVTDTLWYEFTACENLTTPFNVMQSPATAGTRIKVAKTGGL
ncbi:hypothetical protein PO909_004163 [Leuciscus waleckii]